VLAIVLAPVARAAHAAGSCEVAAARSLASCTRRVASLVRSCYLATGAPCASGDANIAAALARLQSRVLAHCPDDATVQTSYGPLATPAALVGRLQEACAGEAATLAARTFGGPQGALLAGASQETIDCLGAANRTAAKLIARTLRRRSNCVMRAHANAQCDVDRTTGRIAAAVANAQARITAACPALADIVGMDVATFVDRADAQARCMTVTANGDSGPLTLDCGPRTAVAVPAPGQWVQVVLDEATWGTRCGDGSSYAFWLKLAPDGSPPERVVVDLQGGGVCISDAQCGATSPALFSATDDPQPTTGYMSTDPTLNPFADWTQIFLPYCTQDIHIGGGTQSVFPSITVNRFGAINVRATMGYLRDALWTTLQATTADGYRPDRLTVLFGGESAGAFGVQYNYHYLLDELRWAHTTAVPDSGLALGPGLEALGAALVTTTNPFGWGILPFMPPYCLASDCVGGPIIRAATSVRLKAVPEQQILTVSNQVDTVQVSTTVFPDIPTWINALRADYCASQGKNGLRFWLPAVSTPYHTILRTNARFISVTAGGVTVRDWLADAMADPDGVVDRVDEGTLVADYPGTNPFACPVGP
jgi:hypothetical protein